MKNERFSEPSNCIEKLQFNETYKNFEEKNLIKAYRTVYPFLKNQNLFRDPHIIEVWRSDSGGSRKFWPKYWLGYHITLPLGPLETPELTLRIYYCKFLARCDAILQVLDIDFIAFWRSQRLYFSVSQWLDFSQCYSSWIFLMRNIVGIEKKVKIIKTVTITVNIDFIQFSCFAGFISRSFVITEVVIVNSSLTFISHMPVE